jgi:hypothetical protein
MRPSCTSCTTGERTLEAPNLPPEINNDLHGRAQDALRSTKSPAPVHLPPWHPHRRKNHADGICSNRPGNDVQATASSISKMSRAPVLASCLRCPSANQARTSLTLLAKITDCTVPEAHQFKVLLPRYPGLVLRVGRISANDDGLISTNCMPLGGASGRSLIARPQAGQIGPGNPSRRASHSEAPSR